MKLLIILLAVWVLAPGCDMNAEPDPEPAAPVPQDEPEERLEDDAAPPTEGAMVGDIVLRLFDDEAVDEEPRLPVFTVSSPYTLRTGEGLWQFQQAEATIRARDGTIYELEAGAGRLDEEGRQALLGDGVVLTGPDAHFELDTIVWENETRTARTDQPLRMEAGGMRLHAESMIFYPDDDHIELDGVSGAIDLRSISES